MVSGRTRGDGAGTRRLSVVLITHKLREMLSVGDRVTVMRRGEVVGTVPRAEATAEPRRVYISWVVMPETGAGLCSGNRAAIVTSARRAS